MNWRDDAWNGAPKLTRRELRQWNAETYCAHGEHNCNTVKCRDCGQFVRDIRARGECANVYVAPKRVTTAVRRVNLEAWR